MCRSCLYSIRRGQVAPTPPWVAAYSSQAKHTKPSPRPRLATDIDRRPSPAELQQYLQGIQELQRRQPESSASEPPSVRFFEQDGEARTEIDEETFGGSLNRLDGSELREALSGIRDALATQEERDAFQTVMREMGGDMDKVTSADDLERMTVRMQAYTDSIDAEIEQVGVGLPREVLDQLRQDLSDLPDLPLLDDVDAATGRRAGMPPQIPDKSWTPNQRKRVARLNLALARAHRDVGRGGGFTKKTLSFVYKAYHSARLPLAHGWGNVPIDVWDLLWAVFSFDDESINTHRLAHVSMLARDMSEAKVTFSPSQQLLSIEAVFVDGWEPKAMESWRRCASTLGDERAETFKKFWELGVRMHCRVDDVDQAERAADKLLDKRMDARILVPIIRALSERRTTDGQDRAWSMYRRMRLLLGRDMRLADYDQVISSFLTTNQTENALHAFVDMMSDGEIDLKLQWRMPSVVANKFFLGKWLKRLIGAGDLNGALAVVEFMRARGVDAAPIHLNGLIGAWQRSGGADDLERADRLAWDMVESRISFVGARREGADGGMSPKDAPPRARPWPRATLETFSLLAENYRQRSLHGRLEALWDAFSDADMRPDAFIMNQLLESHIQAGQAAEAVALYRSLVSERGVSPDPYTFSALWKTLAVNRLHAVAPEALARETQATRRLFAETARARDAFQPGGMDGQLARKVLHTFRRLGDSAGLVVALAALRHLFAFLPPETLALELALGTTRLAWDTPAQRRRLLVAKRDLDRVLLARATNDGTDTPDARAEALCDLLQRKYWPTDGRSALVEAARNMGVYDLLPPEGRRSLLSQ